MDQLSEKKQNTDLGDIDRMLSGFALLSAEDVLEGAGEKTADGALGERAPQRLVQPPRATPVPGEEEDSFQPSPFPEEEEGEGAARQPALPEDAAGERTAAHAPERPAPKEAVTRPNPPVAVAVEEVVASTVESVLAQREDEARRYQKQRRRNLHQQERLHRSDSSRAADTVDFSAPEPSLAEAALRQKRRFRRLKKSAAIVSVLTAVTWVPVVLCACGVVIPFYSDMPLVSAAVGAVLQLAACGAGWSAFSLALTSLTRGRVTCHLAVVLCNVVTLLDTVTAPFLTGRLAAAPLGGISMAALALDLWGECWHAGALKEGFRLVALGKPAYVADLTDSGAAKRPGSAEGFYNRTVREDEAVGWQSLLLPVNLTASVVFAVLASYGRGRGGDFLWCWSAILSAGTALSLPFTYSLPYFRLARRLGKSGCAVAGFYGAKQLGCSRELLVGDEDLFPAGTMRLEGMKLIAEDRRKVAAYAGSLARTYGGTWPGLFEPFMQAEGATQQRMEEFHVHQEGGVSAVIRGETVVLGVANLIRKMSIRLPKRLEWRDGLFLAVDGELVAIFGVVYEPADSVSWALESMRRSHLTPLLATRDPNLQPKFLREYFGSDGGSLLLDLEERLTLTDGRPRPPLRPNALLYREGLAPFLEAVAGSRRLCRAVTAANLITLLASAAGTLLAFYLMFMGRAAMLTPLQLLAFLGLWTLPVLLLAWNTDRI